MADKAGENGARKSFFDMLTHPDRPVMRTLALLGGLAGVVGLVTTVLALRASNDQAVQSGVVAPAPDPGGKQPGTAGKGLPALEEVSALNTGVQLRKFVDLLGEPDRKREVLDATFKRSDHNEAIWQRPSYILQAVTNAQETVVLYTVTTTDPAFHPEIPFSPSAPCGGRRPGAKMVRACLPTPSFSWPCRP